MTDSDEPGHDGHEPEPVPSPATSSDDSRASLERARLVTELFRAHGDLVDRCLARAGLDHADRDDALQDVFMIAMRKIDDYTERGTVRAWLVAIARRVAKDQRRGATRRAERERASPRQPFVAPDVATTTREDADFVNAVLAAIDPALAECFVLCEIESMSAPEIAAATGAKLNTVYSRIRLARAAFARAIEERDRKGVRNAGVR